MSNLKSFLWKNKTSVSVKKADYSNKLFELKQWPDFGFVGCPADYITVSSFLVKHALSYKQIAELTPANEDSINHFIYVCRMLQIIEVKEDSEAKNRQIKLFSNVFTARLKSMFFH